MFKTDAIGKYPIHVAVSSGSLDCLRILLEFESTAKTKGLGVGGVETESSFNFIDNHLINLPDSEGETALHLAVNSGNIEMIDVSPIVLLPFGAPFMLNHAPVACFLIKSGSVCLQRK